MDTASEVLLIIVSSVLAVFLVIFAVALIFIIRILKDLKRIIGHAEQVADTVESAASAFEKTALPLAVLRLVSNIVERVHKMKRKKK